MAVRISFVVALGLVLGFASVAHAASLQVSLTNQTTCRVNLGPAWGSQTGCSSFNSSSSWGGRYGNSHTSTVAGNGTTSVTATLDAGVFSDTAGHADRIFLEQYLWYDLSVTIDVDPGDEWQLHFDQTAAGLFGVREDVVGVSTASQFLRWDGTTDVDVLLGSGNYDIDLDFTSYASGTTSSLPFFGSRSDMLNGTGDAVLTGRVRAVLRSDSQCLNQTSPTFVPCTNGEESTVLFGADGFGGSASVTADDYASWGRAPSPDGYTADFELTIVPEPGSALLVVTGLVLLATRRARHRAA